MGYISEVNLNGQTHKVGSSLYGTCGTTASTATKVVALADYSTLTVGTTIRVKFSYSNSVANPKLNVNGLGAIPIYKYGTTTPGVSSELSWNAGAVVSFTYDGTAWMMNDWNDMSESIANVADGIAILATGDTHAQITKDYFVYVRNHGAAEGFSGNAILADGLYVALANINANGALTTSNLTADGSGGLNALKGEVATLNSKITNMVIEFGTSSKELTQNLTDNWRTAVPNDSRVYFVRIDSVYGAFYGVICRYSDVYGTGVVSRYDGTVYRIQMNNGSCSSYQLQNRPIQVLSTGSKTISGSGNIGYTFSNKVLVLGAYSTSSDIVCSAYPSSGADSSGSAEWWIHCRNANSSSSVASGTITCYLIYINMA